ncbi:CooT family nickel-binding protein [Shewanella chilikensis]|uniref:CooT family nickel-binding protein n=1 Tax=Shewanella chilikensis TaxID=558541 RepID=A0A6G7LPI6_9GAMM|nr:CooT family nickel-binding protein [Shewanella chilikensis]QIJ03708.1 CooT family nickel-binding protein [Shewanella chilikensis]
MCNIKVKLITGAQQQLLTDITLITFADDCIELHSFFEPVLTLSGYQPVTMDLLAGEVVLQQYKQ